MNAIATLPSILRRPLDEKGTQVDVPAINRTLLRLFVRYSRSYLKKHFRAVYMAGPEPGLEQRREPTVVYLNHAAWWDPLICLLLSDRFASNLHNFAPIDHRSLAHFRFFRKLGFFGVEKGTRLGTKQFFRTGFAILRQPDSVLWVTPQGGFVDPRVRPTDIKGGIAQFPALMPNVRFVPLAIEYFFSGERLPYAALRFGEPIYASANLPRKEFRKHLSGALEGVQDQLATEVTSGTIFEADAVLSGKSGTNGIYGWWERIRGKRC